MKSGVFKKLLVFALILAMTLSVTPNVFTAVSASQTGEPSVTNKAKLIVSFDDENVKDTSGNGRDGSIVGQVSYVEGMEGKAIHIENPDNPSNEGIAAANYVKFPQVNFGTESFTIMLWYKADPQWPEEAPILSNKDYDSGGNDGIVLADMDPSGLLFNVAAGGSGRIETNRYPQFTDNTWHHITVTVDRSAAMKLYLDGTALETLDISALKGKSLDVAGNVLCLGADGRGRYPLRDGYIDELAIYEGIVSEEEILAVNAPKLLQKEIVSCRELAERLHRSQKAKDTFMKIIEESAAAAPGNGGEAGALLKKLIEAKNIFAEPEKGIPNFEIMSDTHIHDGSTSQENYVATERGYQHVIREWPDSMGIVNCGDLTDSGTELQTKTFYELMGKYADKIEFSTVMGNHDVRLKPWDEIYERYMRYNAPYMPQKYVEEGTVYHDKWLTYTAPDGSEQDYHFIMLNGEWNTIDYAYISDAQLEWLREVCAEKNPDHDRPLFIFVHQPLKETVYDPGENFSIGEQDYRIKEILRDYDNVFFFSGHLHNGLDMMTHHARDWGYAVDCPGIVGGDSGNDRRPNHGWHVSIYEDALVLSMYDYYNGVYRPEYEVTLPMPVEAHKNGKVLDVSFDDETADDRTVHGNDGKITGNVEFVEGISGKAIRIVNGPEVAGKDGVKAESYVDFGNQLGLGTGDFTVMFWYQADGTVPEEGSIFGNKDYTSGSNLGVVFGDMSDGIAVNLGNGTERREIRITDPAGLTDGKWHHFVGTFDRDQKAVFYVDGQKKGETDISDLKDVSMDTEGNHYVLGADGLFCSGIREGVIDELKVYKSALGPEEIRTIHYPIWVEAGTDSAVVRWDADLFRHCWGQTQWLCYLIYDEDNVDDERILLDTDQDTYKQQQFAELKGLKPDTSYKVQMVTRKDDDATVDVYEVHFRTEKTETEPADYTAVEQAIAKAEKLDPEMYEDFSEVRNAIDSVRYGLSKGEQAQVDAMAQAILDAIENLKPKPATPQTDKTRLEEAIKRKPFHGQEAYTAKSWEAYQKALGDAEQVLKDTAATQQQIDAAVQKLDAAYQGLTLQQEIPTEEPTVPDEEPTEKPVQPPIRPDSPQTGDGVPAGLLLGTMIFAGFATAALAGCRRCADQKPRS